MSDDKREKPHDAEHDDALGLEQLRAMTIPAEFDAGFADRVMQRIASANAEANALANAPPSLVFATGIQRMFWRVAPLAVAAVLVLATLNVARRWTDDQPLLDRALALPAVSLAAAYTFDGSLNGSLELAER